VGANDPEIINNTYKFYREGWTGINIEPHKLKFDRLVKCRPNDINLNIGIANKNGVLEYYETKPDTHSTFSKAEMLAFDPKYVKVLHILQIPVKKLSAVFKECGVSIIDFLTVDTEGYDLEILKSNDWVKYRPKIICIEINKGHDSIDSFLCSVKYSEFFNNGLNSLYIDNISNSSIT